jgi:outer membrane protein assembly factor BamB
MSRRLLHWAWVVVAVVAVLFQGRARLFGQHPGHGLGACRQCGAAVVSGGATPGCSCATAGRGPAVAHPYANLSLPSPAPCGIPTRTALARVGLERAWMAAVPMAVDEQVLGLTLAEGFVFAHTTKGSFHAFDSESGRLLWTTRLGVQTARVRPPSVNSFAVFATNLNQLFEIDRKSGVIIWKRDLTALPSSPTTADDRFVMVGEASGKVYAFSLKVKSGDTERISGQPIDRWNWQAAGPVETRPIVAGKFVIFGADDGKVYVAMSDERTMLYRFATGGPIGEGFGTFGTRTLLVPSADRNLYAIDLLTARVLWTFPSGAPIRQAPLVAGNHVFVVNEPGFLTSLDPNTGSPRWTTSTHGGRLLAVGARRVYLESHDGDLFLVDRATGQMVADPRATFERIGLNLRCYEFSPTNIVDDRIYMATPAGMVVALREEGQVQQRPLRDPKALPFGYIPPEGISLTPPVAPPAAPAEPAAPGEEKPAEPAPKEGEAPK